MAGYFSRSGGRKVSCAHLAKSRRGQVASEQGTRSGHDIVYRIGRRMSGQPSCARRARASAPRRLSGGGSGKGGGGGRAGQRGARGTAAGPRRQTRRAPARREADRACLAVRAGGPERAARGGAPGRARSCRATSWPFTQLGRAHRQGLPGRARRRRRCRRRRMLASYP